MKTIFLGLLAGIWISASTQAAPAVLDLSRSHTVDDLKKSGLVMKEISGGADEQDFTFENQVVEIRLPGRRSIQQMVALGIIDSKEGLLTRFSITGDVMPHDQAIQVARLFHQSFGLPMEPLNQWDVQNQGKIRNGEPYSISANLSFYPRIGVKIKPSMNGLYPWVISLQLSWEWDKHRDWNEERAWRELPPPAIASISLNPPSGLKYERKDAYKESLEAQAKFERELAAQRAANSTESAVPEPEQSGPNWFLILGGVAVALVIGAVAFRVWKNTC